MDEFFGDIGFVAAKKGLSAAFLREKVISQNIANITTPGYESKEVRFEELLREEVGFKLSAVRTHPAHLLVGKRDLGDVEPEIVKSSVAILPGAVNNVDIDREMVELAKNSIDWDGMVSLLSYKYRMLRASITGK